MRVQRELNAVWGAIDISLNRVVGSLKRALNQDAAQILEPNWVTIETALAALPLATGEFATCVQRLRSARTYMDDAELGAAAYELRLLSRSLRLVRRRLGW